MERRVILSLSKGVRKGLPLWFDKLTMTPRTKNTSWVAIARQSSANRAVLQVRYACRGLLRRFAPLKDVIVVCIYLSYLPKFIQTLNPN